MQDGKGEKKQEIIKNEPAALESEEQTMKIIEKLNTVIEGFKHRFESKNLIYHEDNNK